jgi:peroxiredoxin
LQFNRLIIPAAALHALIFFKIIAAVPIAHAERAAPPSVAQSSATIRVGERSKDFKLTDLTGHVHQLTQLRGKAVVLFFTGVGCPIARESLPKLKMLRERYNENGIQFLIVDSAYNDERSDLITEMKEFSADPIPVAMDQTQEVARTFGADRTGMVAVVSLSTRTLMYRGAIDDQMVEGGKKPQARALYLQNALTQLIADRPVEVAETLTHGCLINFRPMKEAKLPAGSSLQ